MMRDALVFGASGQIGVGLLPRLLARGMRVQAVTRGAPPVSTTAGLQWCTHDLFSDAPPPVCADLVFSLGPLDGLLHWLQRVPQPPRRLLAFGSTSAVTKRDSIDPRERALATRLSTLEQQLAQVCNDRGVTWTLLRPTLVYGLGRDRNLTRIVQLARRWRVFVLPADAQGLRQPVHADDLSHAALQAAFAQASANRSYDLAGGETLPYAEMVRRTLACLTPSVRLLRAPSALVRGALALAGVSGRLRDAGAGTLARMREDLVFDYSDAARDFAYAPRPFAPREEMFEAGANTR